MGFLGVLYEQGVSALNWQVRYNKKAGLIRLF